MVAKISENSHVFRNFSSQINRAMSQLCEIRPLANTVKGYIAAMPRPQNAAKTNIKQIPWIFSLVTDVRLPISCCRRRIWPYTAHIAYLMSKYATNNYINNNNNNNNINIRQCLHVGNPTAKIGYFPSGTRRLKSEISRREADCERVSSYLLIPPKPLFCSRVPLR